MTATQARKRFTAKIALAILAEHEAGATRKSLAEKYDFHPMTISGLINGKTQTARRFIQEYERRKAVDTPRFFELITASDVPPLNEELDEALTLAPVTERGDTFYELLIAEMVLLTERLGRPEIRVEPTGELVVETADHVFTVQLDFVTLSKTKRR